MATKDKDREAEDVEETLGEAASEQLERDPSDDELRAGESGGDDDEEEPMQFGAARYVHATLLSAGILIAFLCGKILGVVWNSLAEWPAAVDAVPQLIAYSEDERPTITMVLGAVIGAITVIQVYRKPHIRAWTDEVVQELAKVTWPNRETVTNGTIVVVIAGIIATCYIAVLDRFWGFITGLVYGA